MRLHKKLQTTVSDPINLAEELPSLLSDTSSSLNPDLISQPTSPIVLLPSISSKPDASSSLIVHDKLPIVPIETTPTPSSSVTSVANQNPKQTSSDLIKKTKNKKISDFYNTKSTPKQNQGVKRKNDSPQEKGPVPPGKLSHSSDKSSAIATNNDHITSTL